MLAGDAVVRQRVHPRADSSSSSRIILPSLVEILEPFQVGRAETYRE